MVPRAGRVGGAGTDRVYEDAIGGAGVLERPRQVEDRHVGEARGEVARRRAGTRGAGDIDDAPPALLLHVREGELRQTQEAIRLETQRVVEVVGRELAQQVDVLSGAGVVNQHVDAAVLRRRRPP